jgi:hypothetical protein
MSGKKPEKNEDGSWIYPCSEVVLKTVGLKTIVHYLDMHCQTIANFILNRPIYKLCAGAVKKRNLPDQPFWWDQPMDLDLARERGLWHLSQQGRGRSRGQIANDNKED